MRRLSQYALDLHRLTHVRGHVRHGSVVVVIGLLAVAFAAPMAQADRWGTSADADRSGVSVRPDDRGGIRSAPAVSVPAVIAHHYGVRPDDRAGPRGFSQSSTSQVGSSVVSSASPTAVTIRVDDFDWLDAGIGAAIATFVALLAGGTLFVFWRGRTSPRPV
jgi:hypothetical protein